MADTEPSTDPGTTQAPAARAGRGVSLYSFQQLYYLREKTLEELVEIAAGMGALGIETIAEQMMPGFPHLPDSFYEQWHGWMERYGTTPTAHDMFLDTKRWKDRPLTHEEMVASVERDIDHAAKLGCSVIRMIVITPPEIVEACIPYAAEKRVKLALEIHAPRHFDDEWIQAHYAVYERYGPEWVGFLPDMGIFTKRFPRTHAERLVRDGASERIVAHVMEAYDSATGGPGLPPDLRWLRGEVERMGGNEQDLRAADYAARMVWSDPQRLRDFMPYIHHVHAKFYEMTDEGSEYSIPYEDVVPILIEGGFTGSLSSEYEGQRHIQDVYAVDEVEQVRRQQQLFARLLGETE
jgi:sugar phosphate isomerase/epimerase